MYIGYCKVCTIQKKPLRKRMCTIKYNRPLEVLHGLYYSRQI